MKRRLPLILLLAVGAGFLVAFYVLKEDVDATPDYTGKYQRSQETNFVSTNK